MYMIICTCVYIYIYIYVRSIYLSISLSLHIYIYMFVSPGSPELGDSSSADSQLFADCPYTYRYVYIHVYVSIITLLIFIVIFLSQFWFVHFRFQSLEFKQRISAATRSAIRRLRWWTCVYKYIYIYMYMCVYIYIYIYAIRRLRWFSVCGWTVAELWSRRTPPPRRTSKGIWRQGIVLKHRDSLHRGLMPCRHMPLLTYSPYSSPLWNRSGAVLGWFYRLGRETSISQNWLKG